MANVKETTLWGSHGIRIPPDLMDYQNFYHHFEDFDGAAINVTDGKWASNTIETAGTPTVALVADAANGQIQGLLDNTSELQRAELYWGDQRVIDPTKNPLFLCRVKFSTIAANELAVVGLAADRHTTPDSVATHAWFRLNADMSILIEGEDGTTNTDDVDTGIDAVDDTFLELKIDMRELSKVKFYINGALISTTISIPAATTLLQPYFQVGKTSGTGTPSFTVDYAFVQTDR